MSTNYNRLALRDAVQLAAKVLPSKPVNHLGKCIILRGGNVYAQGDAEAAEVTCKPTSGTGFECQVSAAGLLERLALAKEDEVSLSVTGNAAPSLVVKAKRSRWTLPAVALERVPSVTDLSKVAFETVDAVKLRRGLEACLPAMTVESTVASKFGMLLAPGGQMRTTDGHRAHAFTGGPNVPSPLQLTPAFVKLLLSLPGDTLRMFVGAKDIIVDVPGATFSHRQLGTEFAPIDRVIDPCRARKQGLLTIGVEALRNALEGAALAAEDRRVGLSVEGGELVVTGRMPGGGNGDVSRCDCTGELTATNVNATYLAQAAKAFGTDAVDIYTSKDGLDPILVTASGAGTAGECVLIMPTVK